ncbi:MAG: hypothetical protein WC238_03720 [Parcubacteria group bacterium]|jgi:MFS-type transporter involved in bile tolerance (Atg22 family)
MSGLRPKELAAKSATNKTRLIAGIIAILGCLVISYFSEDLKKAIGMMSGFIIAISSVLYVVSIFINGTRPSRTTWWIWTILAILIGSSYHEAGANNTLWVPIVYIGEQLAVSIISLTRYGEGGRRKLDIVCMAGASIGVVLWWLSGSAALGLAAFIFSDFLGAIPTIEKSYSRPESEDTFAWIITAVGNTLNIFAVERLSLSILAYPVYAAATSSIIVFFLLRRKQKE